MTRYKVLSSALSWGPRAHLALPLRGTTKLELVPRSPWRARHVVWMDDGTDACSLAVYAPLHAQHIYRFRIVCTPSDCSQIPPQEGWCKRHDPMTLKRYKRHLKPTGRGSRVSLAEARAPGAGAGGGDAIAASAACFMRPAVVESVLRAASPMGPGIQLRCPGFLSNARQHRMFGLASLEVAQLARRHWDSVKAGEGGAIVQEAGSSAWRPPQGGGEAPEVGGGGGAGNTSYRV